MATHVMNLENRVRPKRIATPGDRQMEPVLENRNRTLLDSREDEILFMDEVSEVY